MFRNALVFSYCPEQQPFIPILSEILHFSLCLFKAPLPNTQSALIGQLINAWAVFSASG